VNHPPRKWDSSDPESKRYITSVLWGIDIAPLPVVVTLMDVLALAAEYNKLQQAAQSALNAWNDAYNGYRPDMSEAEFADWLRARRTADDARATAEQAAWDAYRVLEFTMLKHAVDTPRLYSGRVNGERVQVVYEPVNGTVSVLVGDAAFEGEAQS
jgi:hypothetical protein